MKKLVPIALSFALVLAACGGGQAGEVAASVNGEEITVGQVESLISVEGSTIPIDQFAQFLGFQIQWDIVEMAAFDVYGIEVTESEIDAEADRIYESASADETREEFTSSRGVTEEFLRNIARQGLLDIAVRGELEAAIPPPTSEEIAAEKEVAAAALTDVCVSHVLVATAEEADDVVARLDAGEEFGAIAQDVSLDTGSGANDGVLPCGSAGQYVPEFRDASLMAPIGEVYSEIVQTQFGFHVMLVTDRVDPDPEALPTDQDVIDQLVSTAVAEELNAWFSEQVVLAEVEVGEEYGTWNPLPPGVTPPQP